MPLGHWGTEMKKQNFNEITYLGKYPVLVQWCTQNGKDFTLPQSTIDYNNLTAGEKTAAETRFLATTAGNCGELANYFLELTGAKYTPGGDPIDHIEHVLTQQPSGVFRIHLGKAHTFIGIKSTDASCQIELLQAWQGEYTIDDWLKRGNNVFTVAEFITTLKDINDAVKFSTASKSLCEVNSKGKLKAPQKVSCFGFKSIDASLIKTCFSLKTLYDGHTESKADKYEWPM
ncbi:hypothetical protein [Pseudomonas nunensis]|uniref:hypothetical protein n=1 Tax=Pseudomonas nunensis TaxID=2961896 RepID=UPI0006B5FF7C|nr:hypothetical protein [Pseudomonas nunensis]KOY03198.1 hypothetical protein AM274_10285 [Pseudomonas nunensis]